MFPNFCWQMMWNEEEFKDVFFFFLYSPSFVGVHAHNHRMFGDLSILWDTAVTWLVWDGSIMAYRSIQDLQHSLNEMPMTTWQMIPARLANARPFFPSFLWSARPPCPLLAKPFRTLLGPFMWFQVFIPSLQHCCSPSSPLELNLLHEVDQHLGVQDMCWCVGAWDRCWSNEYLALLSP